MKNVILYLCFAWCTGLGLMAFFSADVFAAKVKAPYSVKGQMVLEESGVEKGFEFSFTNNSKKTVKEMELVISLFDGDGEPVFPGDSISVKVYEDIMEGDVYSGLVDISDYIDSDEQNLYLVDYFFVKKILYEDGSVSEDPFGRFGQN